MTNFNVGDAVEIKKDIWKMKDCQVRVPQLMSDEIAGKTCVIKKVCLPLTENGIRMSRYRVRLKERPTGNTWVIVDNMIVFSPNFVNNII